MKICIAIGVVLIACVVACILFLLGEDRKMADSGMQNGNNSEVVAEQTGENEENAQVAKSADTAEVAAGEESIVEATEAAQTVESEEAMAAETSADSEASESSEDQADPYADKPDIDVSSWEYILANPWNDIGDYVPELTTIEGQQFDVRIADAMNEFVAAARAEGLSVFLSSGYRSHETQTYLFNRKVQQYGEEVAATIVARPGTSEHQTGLCCDITDRYYELKDSSLENTAMYQWMSQHCQEYGFIVRFPKDRQDVTGIIYEPWHFRYVGVEAATYIMEHDMTLEEFLDLY